ncbi:MULTISPECIES: PQQ-binding-like beta-propeller repeat protein [unclassified Kitasatospora]|uniref:outer membrane protein assembly factor BamB family protein n=1 Tax=unclassified Kitasatospora TaxID=2633591 RepID=UPI002473FC4B|nr:PQQ-binding-like beta-propeller repeat protein [Kitasatospora sp. MAP12-44]
MWAWFSKGGDVKLVITGGLFGAFFGTLGLGSLLGSDYGYGGVSLEAFGLISILGLMVSGAGLVVALIRPRLGLPSIAVGALVGLGVFVLFAGAGLGPSWKAPLDRPTDVRAVGSWTSGDLVIRARPDQVVAYRSATGEVAWRWTPPGEDSVCAMSRETGHGIGLIGHAGLDQPCAAVVALDLSSGTARWTAQLDAPARSGDSAAAGVLAIAGDSAVLQENTDWRALNLANGSAAWRSAPAPGCTPLRVAGGAGGGGAGGAGGANSVVTVADCGSAAPVLRSLAAQDGREQTQVALPTANGLNDLAVLSTAPLTLWVDENGERGTHAVLSYDQAGHLRSSIPVSGDEYDLDILLGGSTDSFASFTARPLYSALVVGDLLIVPAEKPNDVTFSRSKNGINRNATGRLVAYSLADGSKQWTAGLDDQTIGLAVDPAGTGIWALTQNTLSRIDVAMGHRSTSLGINGGVSYLPVDLSVSAGNRFTIVSEDGTSNEPPVVGLH